MTDKCDSYEGGIWFCDLPIEIWNTKISELYIDRFKDRCIDNFNNSNYFCIEMLKSKKNIKIIDDDGWIKNPIEIIEEDGSIKKYLPGYYIIHHNNNIIIKEIKNSSKEIKNIFTFKKNKLYKIFNEDLELIKMKSKEESFIEYSGLKLEFIENQTEELCFKAVQNNSFALKFVNKKFITEKLCLLAFNNEEYGNANNIGELLEFVKPEFITYERCLIIIKNNGLNIKYINEKFHTEELCLIAVGQYHYGSGELLKYIKNPTMKVCIEAVKTIKSALKYVPIEMQTDVLSALANNKKNKNNQYIEAN